ncbi:hydroxyacylglutathione hydrolase [Halomonas denitrificans]|nr:hydroxyacylglutathione hydrolase [Halomonas denitrificans]
MTLQVDAVPAFDDNYIWVLHDGRHAALVDPGQAEPALRHLDRHGLSLGAILLTHHHHDHVGGVDRLLETAEVPVFGPPDPRIPQVSTPCRDGDRISIDAPDLKFRVLETPGHTRTHIAFYGHRRLFSGDTLFSIGCGKLFEGTPEQMQASFDKLAGLPEDTAVHCGHEYTRANCEFALSVEPGNAELRRLAEHVDRLRDADRITLPSTLGTEKQCNPFLRTRKPAVIDAARRRDPDCSGQPASVFGVLRAWKDAG